jgi:hypothetical protein
MTGIIAGPLILAAALSAYAPAESNVSAAQRERTLQQLQESWGERFAQ